MKNFPTIEHVSFDLRWVNGLPSDRDVDVRLQVFEVRLQVFEPDHLSDLYFWRINYGDASYDQDARGFCGAASVPGNGKRFKSRKVAKDLIEQVKEQIAMNKSFP
jgi:hypothetical protein